MHSRSSPQSELYKTRLGRWALNGIELTSGSRFQVKIDGHWINVVIEHDTSGYYAIPPCVRLLKGLHARFLGEWTE